REPGALARRLGLLGWNAHQTAQREARQRRDCRGEGAKLAGRDAALGGLARQIHLQADVEGRGVSRALCREPLRDLQAIERVHPGELLRDRTRLVGLHPPDEGPLRYTSGARPGADLHAASLRRAALASRSINGRRYRATTRLRRQEQRLGPASVLGRAADDPR